LIALLTNSRAAHSRRFASEYGGQGKAVGRKGGPDEWSVHAPASLSACSAAIARCASDCARCASDCARCASDCARCASDCARCASDCARSSAWASAAVSASNCARSAFVSAVSILSTVVGLVAGGPVLHKAGFAKCVATVTQSTQHGGPSHSDGGPRQRSVCALHAGPCPAGVTAARMGMSLIPTLTV
jgi:hypothetical protein